MLPASIAPSALPAPTMLCSSSMNNMIRPSDLLTSLSTAFRRSSNSPRYFAPAMSAPKSSANIVLSFKPSGTSPAMMRCASPSTTAVLPTPGSPIRTGLFLVRRERMRIARRISPSRPITGSIFPCLASSTRSRPNRLSESYVSSGFCDVMRWLLRTLERAVINASSVMPNRLKTFADGVFRSFSSAMYKCSTPVYSSLNRLASSCACTISSLNRRDAYTDADAP